MGPPSPGAALLRHHVFVDLETTGLDPAADRVLEVGALFVEGGAVAGRLERLFDPGREIPPEVQALTGISASLISGCPRFEDALADLRSRFAGWTVVAHNAEFERGFFAGALEQIGAPVLDSCELLHYLHPELPSHSLDALVRWAGVGERARHRALADCEDTFAVLCFALDGCILQGRLADVVDLLDCLESSGTASPVVTLLSGLAGACLSAGEKREGAAAPRAPPAKEYSESAPRAYVRAYLRRGGDAQLRGLSSWFRRRFPALKAFEPGDGEGS